jgi:predicted component of type VI protein secretion system
VRRTGRRRRQLAIVRPNLDHAVTQGLPNVPAMVVDRRDGAGRVIALAGAARRAYDFASVPLRIGSATDSDVRIEPSPDVAPRHAAIYMRDRKIVLRHMGGSRRPTFVAGQPVDLVILEDGDEFVVGPHKFRAEIVESIVETDIPDAGMPEPNGSEPRLV